MLQCCNSANCPKCLPIPLLEPGSSFFFGSGRSRLGTACSITNGCTRVSLSLLRAHTQAVETARARDFLPFWLFSLTVPLPLTQGPQTVFQMLILNFLLERKMFPIGILKLFSDSLANQWIICKSANQGKLKYRSRFPVLF